MRYFRILSYVEAASLLVLFFVAMPLKYLAGMPEAVRIVGTIHGVLFVVFVCASIVVGSQHEWSFLRIVGSWVIASIPFGPWLFERRLFGGVSEAPQ
jgi:integral membrane protein